MARATSKKTSLATKKKRPQRFVDGVASSDDEEGDISGLIDDTELSDEDEIDESDSDYGAHSPVTSLLCPSHCRIKLRLALLPLRADFEIGEEDQDEDLQTELLDLHATAPRGTPSGGVARATRGSAAKARSGAAPVDPEPDSTARSLFEDKSDRRWSVHGASIAYNSEGEGEEGDDESLGSFIVSDEEEEAEGCLPTELGGLLSKLRGGGAVPSVEDGEDDEDDEDDEVIDSSWTSADVESNSDVELDDDGDEISRHEDAGLSSTWADDGGQSELGGLLTELTNLTVSGKQAPKPTTRPSPKPAEVKVRKYTPDESAPSPQKRGASAWTLAQVARALRENGRALGPRIPVQISRAEWNRHRSRLTKELFSDLNTYVRCTPQPCAPCSSVCWVLH
eukprot:SAG11_NODE_798_length_7127_cov_8.227803_5_plen_395_part_00